jgi:hypothetical protein
MEMGGDFSNMMHRTWASSGSEKTHHLDYECSKINPTKRMQDIDLPRDKCYDE